MMAKWDKVPKFGKPPPKKTWEIKKPTLEDLQPAPAKPGKLDAGSTAPRKSGQYTGTAMLGVATMHKSNPVPVFSQEEAVDISKMRRG